jgi:septum formation protein
MSAPRIVLASASPRRRRLIAWLGVPVSITAVDTPEDLSAPLPPERLSASLAAEKAIAARPSAGDDSLVLTFDTIVVDDGTVLGKPADEAEAARMLEQLSARTHEVTTGVALLAPGATDPETFTVTTRVSMRALTRDDIATWIARGESTGCAGAYNIEHHLASVADDECYQNVAGLPLCHLYAALASGGPDLVPGALTVPVSACDRALGRTCLLGPRVCAVAGQAR